MMNIENKKKLFIIITKSNWGGAQKYVYHIAEYLQNNKNYEIFVLSGGNGELLEKLSDKGIKNIIKLKYMTNSLNPIKLLFSTFELIRIISKERPDLIHINSSFALLSSIKAINWVKIISLFQFNYYNNVQIIFTAHGWPFSEDRPVLIKILLKFIMNMCLLFVDKIICVSNYVKLGIWYSLHNKCVVVYNGIDNNNYSNEKINIIKNKSNNIINIISVGELHHIKGYDRMLNILKEVLYDLKTSNLPIDFHYHIVGEGGERDNLIKLQKQLSLDNKITFHGHIKDAFNIISDFDIFIMPSRSEALAFALLEAYNSGVEIIASNVGGLKEIVENANHGTLIDFTNTFEARSFVVSKIISIYISRVKNIYEKPKPVIIFPIQKMLQETEGVYNK